MSRSSRNSSCSLRRLHLGSTKLQIERRRNSRRNCPSTTRKVCSWAIISKQPKWNGRSSRRRRGHWLLRLWRILLTSSRTIWTSSWRCTSCIRICIWRSWRMLIIRDYWLWLGYMVMQQKSLRNTKTKKATQKNRKNNASSKSSTSRPQGNSPETRIRKYSPWKNLETPLKMLRSQPIG